MRKLTGADWWLLGTVLPLFLVCFSLHVFEAFRSGLRELPFYAAPAGDDSSYPTMGSYRAEALRVPIGLRPGDKLLRAEGSDLRGRGAIGVDAVALSVAGADHEIEFEYERAGAVHSTIVPVVSLEAPFSRIPVLALSGAVALLGMLGARDPRRARFFFAGFLMVATYMAPFHGAEPLQTHLSKWVFNVGGALAFPLIMLTILYLPGLTVQPRWTWWVWLTGLIWGFPRANYVFGGPLPAEGLPSLMLGADVLMLATAIATVMWMFHRSDAVGRRRLKWVLLGVLVGLMPALVWELGLVLDPSNALLAGRRGIPALAITAMPIGFAISIARFDMLDVDRVLSATAAFTTALVVLAAGVLALVPTASGVLAAETGIDATVGQLVVAALVALVVVPVGRRLQPRIDRWFFPDRAERERGVHELLSALRDCADESELASLLGRRVAALFQTRSCGVFAEREGELRPLFEQGEPRAFAWRPSSQLLGTLEVRNEPWALRPHGRRRGAEDLLAEDAEVIARLGAAVLVPLRPDARLWGLLCLGPQRTGDVYTRTDLALLTAIGREAAGQMLRLEQHETMGALRVQTEEAIEANQAKSQLLATASHDLRQPVHALGLMVSMLRERGEDSDDLVLRIQSLVDALDEMFQGVLDISRLDADAVQPNIVVCDLGRLLSRLQDELSLQAQARGLALHVVPARLHVRSDPVLLGRILRNLALNALRYTTEGRILIGCRRRGDRVSIQVWDTGPGIPEKYQSEVFRMYRRLGPSESGHPGLGLGLSIVDRLAGLLGHELSLHSESGRGSMFAVSVERSRAPAPEPVALPQGVDLAGLRVLVVDEDPDILVAMHRLLESWGCEVRSAAGRNQARACLAQDGWRPGLLVLDYHLAPEETGLDVLADVRATLGADIPALIVSAARSPEVIGRIRDCGLPLLPKPVSAPRLRAALRAVLSA